MGERISLPAGALISEGKVIVDNPGGEAPFNANLSALPLDEPVLVLLVNESALAARIGFGMTNSNTPALLANTERYMTLTAGLAAQLTARPVGASGVVVGYQIFRYV